MARFREICYDNWKNLKQNFRQGELTLNHVAYWVSIYADRLLILHDKKIDSGLSLKVFNSVPVLTDPVTHRKYIIIPTGVYDLDHDGGIVYISYTYQIDTNAFTQVTFGWTTPESSKRLYWTDEEKPTPDNPYFYRVGNDLFLLGIECIDVTAVEVGLKATFSVCNLDDEMPFPEDL